MKRPVALLSSAMLLLAACPGSSDPPSPSNLQWSVLRDGLDRVPLCAFGVGETDVWIGGGGLGTGAPALLLHWDGKNLAEVSTGRAETIWWIGGTSSRDLWLVGEGGLALRGDGAAGSFTATDTKTKATLFGVWAAASNDVWAVGGNPASSGPAAVLLHWDGKAWASIAPPNADAVSYFKVWGRAADDVHVVGMASAAHWDGKAWTAVPVPTKTSLFTVHGGPSGVFAVGGGPPTLLRFSGGAWQKVTVPDTAFGLFSGVFVDATGDVFVVGERRQRYRLVAPGPGLDLAFTDDSRQGDFFPADLHTVWADGRGRALAVGGNYMALASPGTKPHGIVLRYGD